MKKFVWLGLALVVAALVALAIGPGGLNPGDFVLTEIRLPRVITALAVGFASAAAAALLQLSLRTQLAEPALFGIGSFAALGTIIALIAGFSFGSFEAWLLAGLASTLGLVPLALLAKRVGADRSKAALSRLPLIGIALGAIATAALGLASSAAPDPRLRSVALWAFGSFSLQRLDGALLAAALTLTLVVVTISLRSRIELLALGPSISAGVGANRSRLILLALTLVGMLSATASFATGSIAFIGLMAAVLSRSLFGGRLLPMIVGGGLIASTVLLACDALARTIAPPFEFPLGLFTALIGAPVLILVLVRGADAQRA